jgi:hypothetical protein
MFCRAADAIPFEIWGMQAKPDHWSAVEVVAHLVVVERAVIAKADSVTQQAPLPLSFGERLHLPLWFVEARLVRRKSPRPQDPALITEKGALLGTLRGAREHTFAFLDKTEQRDLSSYYGKHPF